MRNIIIHHHIFKNAGTSVEQVLKENFQSDWVKKEFPRRPMPGGNIKDLIEYLKIHPTLRALSTHTARGEWMNIPDVRVISITFLRHPINRIFSAYQFERQQGTQNFGAVLARNTDFKGYVESRLALKNDLQCRNLQTRYFANLDSSPGTSFEKAVRILEKFDLVCCVSAFEEGMCQLEQLLNPSFPKFKQLNIHSNQSAKALEDSEVDPETIRVLNQANRDDIALIQHLEKERWQ